MYHKNVLFLLFIHTIEHKLSRIISNVEGLEECCVAAGEGGGAGNLFTKTNLFKRCVLGMVVDFGWVIRRLVVCRKKGPSPLVTGVVTTAMDHITVEENGIT